MKIGRVEAVARKARATVEPGGQRGRIDLGLEAGELAVARLELARIGRHLEGKAEPGHVEIEPGHEHDPEPRRLAQPEPRSPLMVVQVEVDA